MLLSFALLKGPLVYFGDNQIQDFALRATVIISARTGKVQVMELVKHNSLDLHVSVISTVDPIIKQNCISLD
ncbi:hypothetical protein WN944_008749 [Citrus x changshan-huyou]|uniref:Uncharacterized protein n=1 Tax=Citrus x changshan-huyou TaxID=2935761 RepID=A0AAP0MNJ9_9ROSI